LQRLQQTHEYARIRVVGLGGGGITAVNRMINDRVFGVEYITVDTDPISKKGTNAPKHLQIRSSFAISQGANSDAAVGRQATLAAESDLQKTLEGSDIVFILAGLGGGTGSGAAPVIARVAKQVNALVIGIVTYPFSFEGDKRAQAAEQSIGALRGCTDTLVVVPNDRLLLLSNGSIGFHETYRLAHNIWCESIRGISELINRSGLINVDYADVRSIMSEGRAAIIATGKGRGEHRARIAATQASRSDLLDLALDGARGLLFNVIGGPDMTLHEVEQAAQELTRRVHPLANVIFGAAVDDSLGDEIKIIAIGTGFGLGDIFNQPTMKEPPQRVSWSALWKKAENAYSSLPS
jgi:cell division protein FtsZ